MKRNPWLRCAGIALSLVALVWTIWILLGAVRAGEEVSLRIDVLTGGMAFALLAASMLVSLPAFWHVMRSVGMAQTELASFAHYHFASQLMKHLPGRFVGVAYQAAIAQHVATPMQWIHGNAVHAFMALVLSVLVPAMLLGLLGVLDTTLCIAVILAVLAFALLVLRPLSVGKDGSAPSGQRSIASRMVELLTALRESLSSRHFLRALGWFLCSWGVYVGAWAVFGASIEDVGFSGGIELCAWYTIAWAIGFVMLVSPSGLGIRELAFTVMASRFDADVLAYVAVAARVALITADLVLAIAFLKWRSNV